MKYKKAPKKPVENHSTAAWSDMETADEITGVAQPSLTQTINAKEYVDQNEK